VVIVRTRSAISRKCVDAECTVRVQVRASDPRSEREGTPLASIIRLYTAMET
jgi:hypothetical protein